MRVPALILMAFCLGGCTIETATYSGPIAFSIGQEEMLVIRALNPPRECRLVAADAVFPAIYAVVAGPMPRAEAEAFIAGEARAPGGVCRPGRR